jgi:hypothetical protein
MVHVSNRSGRGQPEKTCHRYSAAGLASTAEILSDGQYRWSVPPTDIGRHLKSGAFVCGRRAHAVRRDLESSPPFRRGGERPSYGLLFPKRSWTADERTAPKIKSQEAVRIPRDADPDALPDFARFVITASEP